MKKFILKAARRLMTLAGLWVAVEFCLIIAGKKWILSLHVWNLTGRLVSPAAPYQTLLIWAFAVFFMLILVLLVVRVIKEIEYLEVA